MDRKQYNEQLDKIEMTIDKSEFVEKSVFDVLDELYTFKPVSTRYHQIRCKALMKNGEISNLLTLYGEMYSKEAVYEGNVELWQQLIEVMCLQNDEMEAGRQTYLLNRLLCNENNSITDSELGNVKKEFIDGNESIDILVQMEKKYFQSNQQLMAMITYIYGCLLYEDYRNENREAKYFNLDNMLYMYERIQDKSTVIIILDKEDESDYDILSYMLHKLGIQVYMISKPLAMEGEYDIRNTVQVSMDNSIQYDDCIVIPSVSDVHCNNIPYLIDHICREYTKRDFAMVIGQNENLENLSSNKDITKRFARLSAYEVTYMEDRVGFARAGDCLSYIDNMYECSVKELVYRKPTCKFSIVVPARNSSKTLEHTLKTCLSQDYTDEYEIVLSDNSSHGNDQVYELYKRLNDERISYCRTPRQLTLSKSFEYAYLQTKGEFIIPIGSDDGIFPWALQTLDVILKNRDYADIVIWERGFYAWPGFNGGQQNQLDIYRIQDKYKINVVDVDKNALWNMIKNRPESMFSLPNLYINSGFRRGWLAKIYEETGEILGGNCQDIYIGIVNIASNVKIVRTDYPITIAGMSDNSIGSLAKKVAMGSEEESAEKIVTQCYAGTGLYLMPKTKLGKLLPDFSTNVSGIFECIARIKSKNILPYEYLSNEEEIIHAISKIIESIQINWDKCYRYVSEGMEIAKRYGGNIEKWYVENVMSVLNNVVEVSEQKEDVRTYEEGFTKDDGIIIDASRYGVSNIYEAVQLYKNFIHF